MDEKHSEFLRKFMGVQQALFAYIRSAGFGLTDADDILQDVAVELWEHYDSYDQKTQFVAWAIGIAKHRIFNQMRYNKVRMNTVVNSELCERIAGTVADTLESEKSELSQERERMKDCVERLPSESARLIRMRYGERRNLEEIAGYLGKSYAAANMVLSRIRDTLLQCVEAGLEREHT
jgi:RNA polymerase sigma-70 factor, ECF subfamily